MNIFLLQYGRRFLLLSIFYLFRIQAFLPAIAMSQNSVFVGSPLLNCWLGEAQVVRRNL